MPFLTADALTEDPEGLAFLRDVLAQPATGEEGEKRERPAAPTRRGPRRPPPKHGKSEPKLSSAQTGEAPVVAAA